MDVLRWSAGDLTVDLHIGVGPVELGGIRPAGAGAAPHRRVPLVEIDCAGPGRAGNSASGQHRPYAMSRALRYVRHQESADSLEVCQQAPGLEVRTRLRVVGSAIQTSTEVTNTGDTGLPMRYLSSLSLTGFGNLRDLRIHHARNAWLAELRWQALSAEQAGLVDVGDTHEQGTSRGRHAVSGVGSWSSGDFLPMGGIENTTEQLAWAWQVEHCGGWHWELGDLFGDAYLLASGPTSREHHWWPTLAPGERFTTVPVSLTATTGDLTDALRALTRYRRATRRPAEDHRGLPVIFNDYMNCLMGDPTEDKLAPLIAAAAEVGAEYFVIDAGWYSDDGGWWDTVGEWRPSTVRFPNGLAATVDNIRAHGMAPGLWLEPEVVGIHSPVVAELPADAFLTDRGQRIAENGRHHLDYRSPAVRARMDGVVDRLVAEFGVRYFKLDYNIDVFPEGAELLGHNRAYLDWLDAVLDRHPGLVLENCSSGGMRMDHALLARLHLQSTSDQTDHVRYASIAAAAPSALTPEQAAVWAYPQPHHNPEEASFCLVNALLGRIHLSGRIDEMDRVQRERVRTALEVYKRHRGLLATGLPYWPLGLPGWYDRWLALAVITSADGLFAVWHRGDRADSVALAMPPGDWHAEPIFPTDLPTTLNQSDHVLTITLPAGPAARLIRLQRSS